MFSYLMCENGGFGGGAMQDVLLLIILPAVFGFGWFIVGKWGAFLDESEIENDEEDDETGKDKNRDQYAERACYNGHRIIGGKCRGIVKTKSGSGAARDPV